MRKLPSNETEYLTFAQAAKEFGISIRTIYREVKEGNIIVHRFRGSSRISRASLAAYAAARKRDT